MAISSGGNLRGTGFIGGTVTIASGASISGVSGSTLTLNGGLTLVGGSTSNFALTSAGVNNSTALIPTTGGGGNSLTFASGTNTVNLSGTAALGTYNLYSFTGTPPTGTFAIGSNASSPYLVYGLSTTSSQVSLQVSTTSPANPDTLLDVQWYSSGGVMTGAAAVGKSGDQWNSVTSTAVTNQALKSVGGSTTGATLTVSGGGGIGNFGGNVTSPSNIVSLFANILDNNSGNGNQATATPTNVTINGLQQGSYDLYVYQGSNNNNRIGSVVANGVSGTIGPNSSNPTPSVMASPYNYIELPILVGSNGTITMTDTTADALEVDLSGLQLVYLGPKPITWTGGGGSAGNGNWDTTASTANWKLTPSPNTAIAYADGGPVTFDNTGANTNITVQAGGVNPGPITFNNSTSAYTFTNAGSNGIGGTGTTLTLAGGGTVNLNAPNTYTGGTFVNNGTLRVGNSSGSATGTGAVTVGDGVAGHTAFLSAVPSGSGTISGLVTINGPGSGTAGTIAGTSGSTLNLTGGLTLQANSLSSFALGTPNLPGGPALIAVTGNITANGTNTISFTNPQAGDYELFSYTGSTTFGNFLLSTASITANPNYIFQLLNPSGQIDLQVVANPAIFWTGASSPASSNPGSWDTAGTTGNWVTTGGSAATYSDASGIVTFGDTYSNGTSQVPVGSQTAVTIPSGGVAPTTVSFTNSNVNYSIATSGTIGIGGAANVNVSGNGTVTLLSENTFTGAVAIGSGQLNLQNNLAVSGASSINVALGGALQLQTGVTINTTPLTISGTGSTAAPGGALQSVGGANTYGGPITIASGGATIGSTSTTPGDGLTITGSITGGSNTVTFNGAGNISVNGSISGTGPLVYSGTGVLTLGSGNFYSGGTFLNSGTVSVSAISDTGASNIGSSTGGANNILTFNGGTLLYTGGSTSTTRNISLTGAGTIAISSSSSTLTLGNNANVGIISGSGSLTLGASNAGTLILSPGIIGNVTYSETYTGGTFVDGGTLELVQGGATGSLRAGSNLTINSGGTVLASDLTLEGGDVLGYGAGAINLTINSGGTITVAPLSAVVNNRVTLANNVTMVGGTITSMPSDGNGGGGNAGANSNFSLQGNLIATSDALGNPATINCAALGLQSATTVFNVSRGPALPPADLNISAIIDDYNPGDGLQKTGNGIMLISGANTYIGNTTITAGTLRVNNTSGSGTGTGLVNVGDQSAGNAATLTGTGTISGAVTVNGPGTTGMAATIAGISGSTLTLSGGLTLNSGALASFSLGTPNGISGNALIATTSLTANGANVVSFTTPQPGTYDLLSYSTITNPTNLTLSAASQAAYPTYTFQFAAGPTEAELIVAGPPISWTGANGAPNAPWDTGTMNWVTAAGSGTTYTDPGGVVSFGDTYPTDSMGDTAAVASTNVVIQGTGVSPQLVKFVNSSSTYSVSNASGSIGISGPAGIVLAGTGTVQFLSPNTFTGPVSINAGELNVQDSGALGTSFGVTVASGAALQLQGVTGGTAVSIGSIPLTLAGPGLASSPAGRCKASAAPTAMPARSSSAAAARRSPPVRRPAATA